MKVLERFLRSKNRIRNRLFRIDVSGDMHARAIANSLPACLIIRKCFVTLIPSISAFSAERETAIATEL